MSEQFYLNFSSGEQTSRLLVQDAQHLYETLQRLQNATNYLLGSGLRGSFLDELDNRWTYIQRTLQTISDETLEAGQDLATVVQKAREIDQQSAMLFRTRGPIEIHGGLYGSYNQNDFYNWVNDAYGNRVEGEDGFASSIVSNLGHYNTVVGYLSRSGMLTKGMRELFDLAAIPDGGALAEWLGKKGIGQLASMTTTQEGFDRVLDFAGSKAFSGMVNVGGGMLGGLIDYAAGGEYSSSELATQLISGGIQGAIGMTPIGRGLQLGDAVLQLGGGAASQLIEDNAMWLASGDAARAQDIVDTADRFQDALQAVSLDNRIDGIVNSVVTGQFDQIDDEIMTGIVGMGGVVVEGADLAGHAIQGVLDHTQIDEQIGEGISNFANGVSDFFGF